LISFSRLVRPATTARLPANLLQAQRDYFGAHTYEPHGRAAREVLPPGLARPEAPAAARL